MNANERVFFLLFLSGGKKEKGEEGAFSLGLLGWVQACAGGYAWGLSPRCPTPT